MNEIVMLINLETKEVFVHIPKTGGTTVAYSLQKWKSLIDFSNAHTSIDQFKEKISDYENYKYYTFVRNPYYRFTSMYNYLLFKGIVHDTPITFATNIFTGKYNLSILNPMCYFCKKIQLTDFGRLETFDEDFKRMFKCDPTYLKMNQTQSVDLYKKFPQLRDMVARLYYEDFVEFGYDIQPFIYKSIPVTWTFEKLKEHKINKVSYVKTGSVNDKIPLIFIEDK